MNTKEKNYSPGDLFGMICFILGLIALAVFYAVMEIYFHPSTMSRLAFGAFCLFCYHRRSIRFKFEFVHLALKGIREMLRDIRKDLEEKLKDSSNDLEARLNEVDRMSEERSEGFYELQKTKLEEISQGLRSLEDKLDALREQAEKSAETAITEAAGEKDEVGFEFSLPESGTITVYPAKKKYAWHNFFASHPMWANHEELYKYDIRDNTHVFTRLVERSEHGGYSDTEYSKYEVVNGTVLSEADATKLNREIAWHELTMPEKYFILSKHGISKHFFAAERKRLQQGLAAVKKEAKDLGALASDDGFVNFQAPQGATEEQKTAVHAELVNLLTDARLKRHRISRDEYYRQVEFMLVLNQLLAKSTSTASV
jgi:hypothetical protein